MKSRIRVGVVGCGFNCENHLRVYSRSSQAELAAVCDVDRRRAAIQADRYRVPRVFDNLADMLDLDLDLVDVITPVESHCEVTTRALEAGHDVLVEKPMARSSRDCARMIETAHRHGRTLSVVHNKRFFDSIVSAKNLLERRAERVIRLRYSHYLAGKPPRDWMLDDEYGLVWDAMVHPVYITLHFLGPVRAVCAVANRANQPVVDSTTALLRTEGAIGVCEIDRNPNEHVQAFQLLTASGLRLDGEVMQDYLLERGRRYRGPFISAFRSAMDDVTAPWSKWRPILGNIATRGFTRSALPYEKTFDTQIEATLSFLRGARQTLPVPPEEGLRAIQVLEAIERSLRSGQWETC